MYLFIVFISNWPASNPSFQNCTRLLLVIKSSWLVLWHQWWHQLLLLGGGGGMNGDRIHCACPTPCRQLVGVALLTTIWSWIIILGGTNNYPVQVNWSFWGLSTNHLHLRQEDISVQFLAREKTHSAGIINSADNKQKIWGLWLQVWQMVSEHKREWVLHLCKPTLPWIKRVLCITFLFPSI